MCEPESREVVQEVAPELQEEADECCDAAVERAARKVKILCNNRGIPPCYRSPR
ncbi:MAG: hypothetical protein ABFS37_03855 [Acidobacteriota bacterium]